MEVLAQKDPAVEPGTVDSAALRKICSLFVTGITVVTSRSATAPVGITVNSFTSVSLEPPLVLFCLRRESGMRAAVRDTGFFAVNILTEDQQQISRTFASRDESRFDAVDCTADRNGMPVLVDALAHLGCRLEREIDAGDHLLILGEVTEVGVLRGDEPPLTFFRGAHRRLRADLSRVR